jgi:cell fate (sporulation/competence/biofilm development) regulator YlbF (YheA/YmcA/DUF963 family)
MSMIATESAVMTKARELCEAIAEDPDFAKLQANVESFLNDREASLMYQSVQEQGMGLQQKQQAGIELAAAEIQEFEAARDELLGNDVARSFMDAQGELENLQRTIGKYVGKTMELGRVPSPEDLADEGDCCGGGCGCS